jgi:DNA (cytosine-5)-methyltransferase 1
VNYLDLFAGIGGFALAAERAGMKFERHYFSEVDKYAISVYKKRFPAAVPLGDIRGISGADLPQGDWLLTGGFPCQDISTDGKRAGLDGDRSGLWFEYARLIGELRPAVAVMENVGALAFRGFDRVLGSLAEIGYDAVWQDIRASDVGAPHRRERIWIVAYPEGDGRFVRGAVRLKKGIPESVYGCQVMADNGYAAATGLEEANQGRPALRDTFQKGAWETEPNVGRVVDGVSHRMDRLKCLGNAIVPQIAELIFRSMAQD